MRQNQNAKRSRGRGRRSSNMGQNNINRNTTFDSNGPEGRLRGNAQQLFEKYTALAHDAQASGERVLFEAHSQFADHYYRIHQSILANAEQRRLNEERSQRRRQDAKPESEDGKTDDVSADASSDEVVAEDNQPAEAASEAEASEDTADIVAEAS